MPATMTQKTGGGSYGRLWRTPGLRRYLLGEVVSCIGNAVDDIALVLLAIEIAPADRAGLAVGLAMGAYTLPGVAVARLARDRIGRLDGRTLILIDSVWRGSILTAVGATAMAERLNLVSFVIALSLSSLTKTLATVGVRRLVVDSCDPVDYWAANHVLGSVVQTMTIFGPAIAATMTHLWTAGAAVAVDGATFFVLAAVLLRPIPATKTDRFEPQASDKGGTAVSAARTAAWRWTVTTTAFFILYGPFVVALPLLAIERRWPGEAESIGALWAAFGVGSIAGAVHFAARPPSPTLTTAAKVVAAWAATTLVVSASSSFAVALVAMAAGGFAYAPYGSVVSTAFQRLLTPEELNRVGLRHDTLTSVGTPVGTASAGVALTVMSPALLLGITGAGLAILAGSSHTSASWLDERMPS